MQMVTEVNRDWGINNVHLDAPDKTRNASYAVILKRIVLLNLIEWFYPRGEIKRMVFKIIDTVVCIHLFPDCG